LVAALSDAPSYIVQYGGFGGNWTSRFCQLPKVGAGGEGVQEAVAEFGKFQQVWMKENKIKVSDYIGSPNSTKLEDNTKGTRQWLWQVCTEYGFLQTAPPKRFRLHRSRLITVDYYLQSCHDAFGLKIPRVPNIARINLQYHAQHIHASRIVYVNGELDPWRRLSLSAPNAPIRHNDTRESVYVVAGGHHCDDLRGDRDGDNDSLKNIRDAVDANIIRWLSEKD